MSDNQIVTILQKNTSYQESTIGASNWHDDIANIPSPIISHNSFSGPSQKQVFSGKLRGVMKTSARGENLNPGRTPA